MIRVQAPGFPRHDPWGSIRHMFKGIDLYSDTATKPTPGMRKAMLEAEVGDEQKGEDPTTLALEEKVADLLGKGQSLFFPSATMANEVAIQLLCEPGDEIMAAETSHVFFAEAGGPAVHSRVLARPISSDDGTFPGEDVRKYYRWSQGLSSPISKLVCVENTTNMGGGVPWPGEKLDSVLATCRELNLKTHLDGARLFNAVVASGLSPAEIASRFDTVTLCLSKGLGCPAGALLAFEKGVFPKVRRLKLLMGGALRQSGILAAAGLYALTHHVGRLAEDHHNAGELAVGLGEFPQIQVENSSPRTNMIYFRWMAPSCTPAQFAERCAQRGLRFSRVGENRFRAVTHLDIKSEDIDRALQIISGLCREL